MESQLTTLEQRLALLMEMKTFPDHALNCQKAVESLSDELASLGMHVVKNLNDHPSLVATTQPTKQPAVLFVAHLDIVPESEHARCELVAQGDKLTGRGVYDMKFAVACYLELVHNLSLAGLLHRYDFGIMLTTDEEIGGEQGVGKLLNDGWSTKLAIIPDGGENWCVEEAAKGILSLELVSKGRSAHGSRPWEGINAITHLTDLLAVIQQQFPYRDQDSLTASINQISGGHAINQIPDTASANIDIRAFSSPELDEAGQFIRDTARKYDISVNTVLEGQPVILAKDSSYVQTALSALEAYRDTPVEYSRSFGTTDGRWFSLHDIPCLIVRPRGGDIHGPNEWLLRDDLPKFYEYVREIARAIAAHKVDIPLPEAQNA